MGSVLNLAARLMSKAHGQTLIDEATVGRLPADMLRTLVQVAPMTLRGTDEAIRPYTLRQPGEEAGPGASGERTSGRGAAPAPALDGATDDLSVRAACRDAFHAPLRALLARDAPSTPTTAAAAAAVPSSHATASTLTASEERLQFLVIEGRAGTGREEAVQWLRSYCCGHSMRCVTVRLGRTDSAWRFRALAKVRLV